MTKVLHVPVEDDALDEPTPVPPTQVARIWKKRAPNEGSLGTSLKAMDVLYDAGEPLTREELEIRLMARLDPYERSYLEAWYVHRQEQMHRARKSHSSELKTVSSEHALHGWMTSVFLKRLQSKTVLRTADGRLQPGPGAPRIARADGRVLPYTRESREVFAQEDRDKQRQYLAGLEWAELLSQLPVRDPAARAQLLALLLRRLIIGIRKGRHDKWPLDERLVSPKLNRLVSLANTPAIQQAILQRALDVLWQDTEPT